MFKKFNLLSLALFLRSLSWIRIPICNPHLECGFRMRIQETKIMRIHADVDADPQHWAWNISLLSGTGTRGRNWSVDRSHHSATSSTACLTTCKDEELIAFSMLGQSAWHAAIPCGATITSYAGAEDSTRLARLGACCTSKINSATYTRWQALSSGLW